MIPAGNDFAKAHFGYCEDCWAKLPYEQRAVLQEIEVPPASTSIQRISYIITGPSLWKVFAMSLLGTLIGEMILVAIVLMRK